MPLLIDARVPTVLSMMKTNKGLRSPLWSRAVMVLALAGHVACAGQDTSGATTAPAAEAADFTAAPQVMVHVIEIPASAQTVWAYVADSEKLPEYVPGVVAVRVDQGDASSPGPGTVRYVQMAQPDGSTIELVEDIVAFEPERTFGYSVREGNPMGLREHLGFIKLHERDGTTTLTWAQHFKHDDMDTMSASIGQAMDILATQLAEQLGGSVRD